MNKIKSFSRLILASSLLVTGAFAVSSNEELIQKIKDSKHSLLQGIQQAEETHGFAISAKFELEGSELNLSVYTSPEGKATAPESSTLTELNGSATSTNWTPGLEVFADKAHIARASMHLTLMQLSKLSLSQAIERATELQSGTVFSVTPAIQGEKAVCVVLMADNGTTKSVVVPLQ